MSLTPPPSSRRTPAGAARFSRRHARGRCALASALLAAAFGCAGSGGDGDEPGTGGSAPGSDVGSRAGPSPAAAPPSTGCPSRAGCAAQTSCSAGACGQTLPPVSLSAGEDACSVVSCPGADGSCCSAAEATATGNPSQAYSSQLHMLQRVSSSEGEVRADFMFDAPDQQGWVTFELGAELDLSRVEFVGRHNGVSDRFISVTTNERGEGGCSLAIDLDPLPTPDDSNGPNWFEGSFKFSKESFCYDGGHPGRASSLAFAIFSTEPGPASLIISSITLTTE